MERSARKSVAPEIIGCIASVVDSLNGVTVVRWSITKSYKSDSNAKIVGAEINIKIEDWALPVEEGAV